VVDDDDAVHPAQIDEHPPSPAATASCPVATTATGTLCAPAKRTAAWTSAAQVAPTATAG
jgi:hypothetical protein